MTAARRLPSPSARRKLLSGYAHDLRGLIQAQGLSVKHLQTASNPSEQSLLEQMSAVMEQIAFETTSLVEASYACVGDPAAPTRVAIDDLVSRATWRLGDLVRIEPSSIVVEVDDYAVARAVRDMVYLLSRAKVAKQFRIAAQASRGRLTIEVTAADGTVRTSAMRLREQLDDTFATLESLTGVVVSVKRDGRGIKAVFPVHFIADARPRVLVLTRDPTLTRQVVRVCRGAAVEVQAWPSSFPVLVALQEFKSADQVAACVIDAVVSDDCTERLYEALRREPFRGRAFVVSDESKVAGPPSRSAEMVPRGEVVRALKASLDRSKAN